MTEDLNMGLERERISVGNLISLWFPVVGYMVLIFTLSSAPAPSMIPDVWNIDKLIHFVEYGILAILWYRALRGSNIFEENKISFFLALTLTILFGITDEVHQYFVPERVTSISDVIADGLGAWSGLWLYRRF